MGIEVPSTPHTIPSSPFEQDWTTFGEMIATPGSYPIPIPGSSSDWSNAVKIDEFNESRTSRNVLVDHVNDWLEVQNGGVFIVTFKMEFDGSNNTNYSGAAFTDSGATQLTPKFLARTSNAVQSTGISTGIVNLLAGAQVEAYVQNESSGADITLLSAYLSLARIG